MSIRQRLYPESAHVPVLERHCAHARFVWNLALEQANCWRRERGPTPGNAERMRQLTEARADNTWLAAGSTVVQQGALRDFDRCLRNWWGGSHSRPSWRKAGVHEGFVVRDLSVRRLNRTWAQVLVPKAGYVRFRLTRPWEQIKACTSARVTCDRSGRWHASFTCPAPAFEREITGAVIGIDRGAVNSVATSDGAFSSAPGWSEGEQGRFLVLAQRFSRQRRDSRRRELTRQKLARLYARLGDRRKDWVEQTSTRLVREYDVIAIEKLNTRGMTRRPKPKPDESRPGAYLPNQARAKAKLNRAILASAWGMLERRWDDKTSASGTSVLITVDPRNTSRTCAACGHVAVNNRESQAEFCCQACGHQEHADTNASVNIRERALDTLLGPSSGPELCGGTRRERTHETSESNLGSSVNQPAA